MKTILLLEDNLQFANQCIEELLRNNFNVKFAANPEKAKQLFIENKIDIVIVDLMLPPTFNIEGLDFYRFVKNKNDKIHAIFMTSKSFKTTEIVAEAMKLGAKDFLDKENDIFLDKLIFTVKSIGLQVSMKNKILFLTSNPSNTSRLRIGKEARDIEEALKDSCDFVIKLAVRPKDLARVILNEDPQILHFSGHGKTEGIVLENERGKATTVRTKAIGGLFSLFGDTIKCVFLNSCYSKSQAQEISKHIPYVIGMRKAVPDATAIAFAISFYDAIGAGKDIEFAYNFGIKNTRVLGLTGVKIPVLLKKVN